MVQRGPNKRNLKGERVVKRAVKLSTVFVALFAIALSPFSHVVKAETAYQLTRNDNVVHVDWEDVASATEYIVTPVIDGAEQAPESIGLNSQYADEIQPNTSYSYKVSATISEVIETEGEEPPSTEERTEVLFTTSPTCYGLSRLAGYTLKKAAYNKAVLS